MKKGIELMADVDNQKGGIDIGGEKYKVEVITYDSGGQQATATAAINRLVFEDKVSYILAEPNVVDPWLAITEKNKVLAVVGAFTPGPLFPTNHYSFQAMCFTAQDIVVKDWYVRKYPDKKNIVIGLPDNPQGQAVSGRFEAVFKAAGDTVTKLFFPPESTDLSALGTKVKTINPDVYCCGASPQGDSLAMKSIWQAGWRGTFFINNVTTIDSLSQTLPAEALEHVICFADTTEFEPALTQAAKDYKSAWIAKYGKWENAGTSMTIPYSCLIAGLQKAGSLDTDKVAAAIGSGLEFESPAGTVKMVDRADMGNDRTVDSVVDYRVKQIKGGKIELLDHISLDDAIKAFKQYAPLLGGPPPKK
jgi:branched-chain amino acid transport system substrate-binding protein